MHLEKRQMNGARMRAGPAMIITYKEKYQMHPLEQLPSRIYELFTSKDKIEFDSDLFNKFGSDLAATIADRLSASKDYVPAIRMSSIGKPFRQQWMDIHSTGPVEELRGDALYKFLFGDIIEAVTICLAKQAGYEVTDEQAEVELDGVKGHIDCRINGIVCDVKSCSSYSFNKFANGSLLEPGNDPFGYVGQLAGYAEALDSDGGAFIAVDKTLGKIAVLRLSRQQLQGYGVRDRLAQAKAVVERAEPPVEMCYDPVPDGKSGNMKLAVGCSYCKHKLACYPEVRTFLYSTGPSFLTKVMREPNVPEL